jgi:hypothetical protein
LLSHALEVVSTFATDLSVSAPSRILRGGDSDKLRNPIERP